MAEASEDVKMRAERIKKQLQEHAKVKSQLAQAQSQLQKTAVEWRRERSKKQELDRLRCCRLLRTAHARSTQMAAAKAVSSWAGQTRAGNQQILAFHTGQPRTRQSGVPHSPHHPPYIIHHHTEPNSGSVSLMMNSSSSFARV